MQKRIMHVVPRLDIGGAERLLLNVLPLLKAQGYHQSIVALDDRGALVNEFRALQDANCSLHIIKMDPKRPWTLLSALLQLHALIRKQMVSVVQGWLYIGNIAASIAAFAVPGVKVVWGVHAASFSIDDFALPSRVAIWLSLLIAKSSPASIVYCTEQSRIDHEELGFPADCGEVVENGIDTAVLARTTAGRDQARDALGISRGQFVVSCVARFAAQKDIPNLFRSVALMPEAERPLLLLIGNGMSFENPHFVEAFRDSGLTMETCRVLALDGQIEPYRWMAAADLMVLPSAFGEALPLVVLESLAMGIPVVATRVGGVATLQARLAVGRGLRVVPASSAADLAEAIGTARDEVRFGYREKAGWMARVAKLYEIGRVAMDYHRSYERLALVRPETAEEFATPQVLEIRR
jgi:glycosyltransferase involved in cell wall biosynthesis